MPKLIAFLLFFCAASAFGAAIPSPFTGDGSGVWVWLPDGKASGYLYDDFGGGSVSINGCAIFNGVATEYDSGADAQTSDVIVPIDLGGPGWVRFVLSGSTAPSLSYDIRPASQSTEFNPTAFDCAD